MKSNTPASGGEQPIADAGADSQVYSDRPYEKRLTESGRRFISIDIDAKLLENLDRNRGKDRRGKFLDKLLADAFDGEGDLRMSA